MSAKAGFKLNFYNLKFPSATEPLAHATHLGAEARTSGVMEAKLDDKLIPRFLDIIQKKGCIPNIQMYLEIEEAAGLRREVARRRRDAGHVVRASRRKAKGWKPSETALVECTDPDNGPRRQHHVRHGARRRCAPAASRCPTKNVFKVVCKYQTKPNAETTITDWLTAHPESKFPNLMFNSIDDERMQGMTNAMPPGQPQGATRSRSRPAPTGSGSSRSRPARRWPRSRTSRSATASG